MNKKSKELKEIPNPLRKCAETAGSKGVETANALVLNTEGTCPKCSLGMGLARLGRVSQGQEVHFCATCRVAYPIKTR